MNYESFQHSLVISKIWLCEQLELVLHNEAIRNPKVHILASWDSLLSFIMLSRKPSYYGIINNYDYDLASVNIADKICDAWKFEYPKVYNYHKDIMDLNFSNEGEESIFINCSVDQIDGIGWYDLIPNNRMIVIQCTDLPVGYQNWDIKQSYNPIELTTTYPLSRLIYSGSKMFSYGEDIRFNRNMVIGIK